MGSYDHAGIGADSEQYSPHAGNTAIGTLVTVGSSDKYPFDRLLEAVVDNIERLPQPVFIQCGASSVQLPVQVRHVAYVDRATLHQMMLSAKLIICHAGVGTVLDCLELSVPFIPIARWEKHGEAPDDHQVEFLDALLEIGAIDALASLDNLVASATAAIRRTRPKGSSLNRHGLANEVRRSLATLRRGRSPMKLGLAASSGGHFAELRHLECVYRNFPHFYIANRKLGGPTGPTKAYFSQTTDHDWRTALSVIGTVKMLIRERPAVIVSTGSSSTLLAMFIGRYAFNSRVIYIESLTRVRRPSFTGKIAYLFADVFIYRWPALGKFYRRATLVPASG